METVVQVPTNELHAAAQVRTHFDDPSIIGLAISARTYGILEPLHARRVGEKLVVTRGERRLRAAIKAGLSEVPVIIEKGPQDEATTIATQIVENVQRADLLPWEKSVALDRLMKVTGWNATETGRHLGLSSATITKLLALLTLPDPIKAQLAEGKISLSTAYELAKVQDTERQSQLANEAAAGRLTRDAAVAASRRRPHVPKPRPKRETFRAKAKLHDGGTISISGPKVSLVSFVQCLDELLSRAREAERQGLELSQFLEHFHSPQGERATCAQYDASFGQPQPASVQS